jgi:hypothetical protein
VGKCVSRRCRQLRGGDAIVIGLSHDDSAVSSVMGSNGLNGSRLIMAIDVTTSREWVK